MGLVGWPRTDVWSAASGGAETESQFRDGRRRAPFSPTSATLTGERDRFRPLAPPVAVWAALCGGVAGVWPWRRDRAPWAGCERVSFARGCASCPNVSPDGPTGPPLLRGGASHEVEGRNGARNGGAGRVGPAATRRRRCVLRQIGDQLIPGLEEFLFVDDVVAVEDGTAPCSTCARIRRRIAARRSRPADSIAASSRRNPTSDAPIPAAAATGRTGPASAGSSGLVRLLRQRVRECGPILAELGPQRSQVDPRRGCQQESDADRDQHGQSARPQRGPEHHPCRHSREKHRHGPCQPEPIPDSLRP